MVREHYTELSDACIWRLSTARLALTLVTLNRINYICFMEMILLIGIIVAFMLVGFFAGIEVAFVSANKLPIELKKKQGLRSGKIFRSLWIPRPNLLAPRLLALTWRW